MNDRGSALPMVLGVIAAMIVVLALAVDVTLYAAATREVAYAADVGAIAGASRLDIAARYTGELRVDADSAVTAATTAAMEARPRPRRSVAVTATLDRVCVTVTQPFEGRLVAVSPAVAVTACAFPAEG
jgi:hypothetical protein